MPSGAYQAWTTHRQHRIAELLDAHAQMGGSGRGRRGRTEQVNWALTARLTGEFQGFARDLHDEASDVFASRVGSENAALRATLAALLKSDRQIDKRNPMPEALAHDFDRFGFQLWPALRSIDMRNKDREQKLKALVEARNAVSHDDTAKLTRLERDGYPIRLATIRSWRSTLDGLARQMDRVVAAQITAVAGGIQTW